VRPKKGRQIFIAAPLPLSKFLNTPLSTFPEPKAKRKNVGSLQNFRLCMNDLQYYLPPDCRKIRVKNKQNEDVTQIERMNDVKFSSRTRSCIK
jgi:hypothetical protein